MDEHRIVPLQASDGSLIYVDAAIRGAVTVVDGPVQDFIQLPNVDDIWQTVVKFVEGAATTVEKLAPTTFSVELGLSLEGETGGVAGWVIGKATGTASVTVTLEWAKPAPG